MKKLNRIASCASHSDSSKEFEAYFTEVFGISRWKVLRKALLHPSELIAFKNQFSGINLADEATLMPWFSNGTCINTFK
jgi:hypothetical protein